MLRVAGAVAAMWAALAIMIAGSSSAFEALAAVGDDREVRSADAEAASDVDVVALALDGTLRVSGRTCNGQLLGSGFVLDGLTLTNRHLVEGSTEFKVDNPSARSVTVSPSLVTIYRRADELDLVSAAQVGTQIFTAAEENPEIGDLVYAAGHAGGGETIVLAGPVHLFDVGSPWGYGGEVMLLDVSTTGGFSGGPVLDEHGHVVGILQGFSPTLDLSIAIPIESIAAWTKATGSARAAECD